MEVHPKKFLMCRNGKMLPLLWSGRPCSLVRKLSEWAAKTIGLWRAKLLTYLDT
ncbi:hypothetical protein M5D96_004100 [Drosophila gunungcola]|uniref:Uncharacterized protein n=1 Tax=Drosophila gunungcola TaxID=103775 RepID=A0A9P9YTG2_9MUSC|nr:hypothetical protein M5D96_004100 [Drosophila gunungcola]